jgi:hypothetical protein
VAHPGACCPKRRRAAILAAAGLTAQKPLEFCAVIRQPCRCGREARSILFGQHAIEISTLRGCPDGGRFVAALIPFFERNSFAFAVANCRHGGSGVSSMMWARIPVEIVCDEKPAMAF